MLHIAGGIILAVVILAFAPYIIGAGLLLVALAIVGLIIVLVITNETVRVIAGLFAGFCFLVWVVEKVKLEWVAKGKAAPSRPSAAKVFGQRIGRAGGMGRWLGDCLLEVRPAITNAQKIRKEAARIVRKKETERLIREREHRRIQRTLEEDERRKREADERRRAWELQCEARLGRAREKLRRGAQRLEHSFAEYGFFRFVYGPERIEVRDTDHKNLMTLGCDLLNGRVIHTLGREDALSAPVYQDRRELLSVARVELRRRAADHIAQQRLRTA